MKTLVALVCVSAVSSSWSMHHDLLDAQKACLDHMNTEQFERYVEGKSDTSATCRASTDTQSKTKTTTGNDQ